MGNPQDTATRAHARTHALAYPSRVNLPRKGCHVFTDLLQGSAAFRAQQSGSTNSSYESRHDWTATGQSERFLAHSVRYRRFVPASAVSFLHRFFYLRPAALVVVVEC